jgi:hypothetical protein
VLLLLVGIGSVVVEETVAVLVRDDPVTPEAISTVMEKDVASPTSRPDGSVQVTVSPDDEQVQLVSPPPPLENVSPLGRGSVTFSVPAASDGPWAFVTVKSYVPCSPARNEPACTLLRERSADVTMVVGSLDALLVRFGSFVEDVTDAELVIVPGA